MCLICLRQLNFHFKIVYFLTIVQWFLAVQVTPKDNGHSWSNVPPLRLVTSLSSWVKKQQTHAVITFLVITNMQIHWKVNLNIVCTKQFGYCFSHSQSAKYQPTSQILWWHKQIAVKVVTGTKFKKQSKTTFKKSSQAFNLRSATNIHIWRCGSVWAQMILCFISGNISDI